MAMTAGELSDWLESRIGKKELNPNAQALIIIDGDAKEIYGVEVPTHNVGDVDEFWIVSDD